MKEESERSFDTKGCPICSELLPRSEFGICRARKDGRNLYCKSCIRKKVTDSRLALREYKSARKRQVTQQTLEGDVSVTGNEAHSSAQCLVRVVSKLSPIELVRQAIKNGARTQHEIRKGAKLGDDEVGDALVNLLLWTREIRTEVIDNDRMYFINGAVPKPVSCRDEPKLPPRKRDVPSSFSLMQGLMPGKKAEGESERAPGWVAA